MLFFQSDRPGGYGTHDIWVARRKTLDDPWDEPFSLGPPVNSSDADGGPTLSPDGKTLYFLSGRAGGSGAWDLWQAPIIPIVDLNGDGIVDSADMRIMVDHWGEDYSLCDIGPMPWGDAIVDVQDLIVLAEHLFEEVSDPTLVAHWALDETEGMTAQDSVSGRTDFVFGAPVWQPDGGMVDGALQLDGIDDCVITMTSVLNPSEGNFSAAAWVKGGAPGQVIVAQQVVADWLILDAEGKLMTEIKSAGRPSSDPLLSDAIITDGGWHRIGLVWDGSHRHLCADGEEVAKDAAPLSGLEDAYGGLYFGAGSTLASGTFFSGLIDDIRIYNRAVSP